MYHSQRLKNFDNALKQEIANRGLGQHSWDIVNSILEHASGFTLDTKLSLEILIETWKNANTEKNGQ